MIKPFLFLFPAALAALPASSQIAITTSALTYMQDFNTLDTTGTGLSNLPAGWAIFEWGGASANTTYRAGTGSSTTGDTYSFGKAGSADRALGSLASSGVPKINYGATFINKTGSSINAMQVSFKAEQWRRSASGNPDSVRFYFSAAAGNSMNDTGFAAWTYVPALLSTSVTTASPASAINGNDSFKMIMATVPVRLPAGDSITLRWHDFNSVGNDDAMSIDSLTVVFTIGSILTNIPLSIVSLSPAPAATGVAPTASAQLLVTLNREAETGAGSIYLKARGTQVTETIQACTGCDAIMSGKVLIVTNLGLQPNQTYHVTFDSTVIHDTAGNFKVSITDTAAWVFSTIGTAIIEASNIPALSLNVEAPATHGIFHIRCSLNQASILRVTVYDLKGQEMISGLYPAVKGDNHFRLEADLPAGTYIIRASNGSLSGSVKAMMQ